MSKKHKGGPAPVPPGNRPHAGPAHAADGPPDESAEDAGAPFEDQDPQRRLGDHGGAGEHPRQQPGALNDGDQHSR